MFVHVQDARKRNFRQIGKVIGKQCLFTTSMASFEPIESLYLAFLGDLIRK